MNTLPKKILKVGVPPIKIQGIKTKLVPFILENIAWSGKGQWIEPFLGSGVVAFNLAPQRALLSDTNEHIVNFYRSVQKQEFTIEEVRLFLESEGKLLAKSGVDHYYKVRERFNKYKSPLDFIFVNRSCFNGVMRFNSKGGFNTPFGHKPERFSQSYITKICNQIGWVSRQMGGKDWMFIVADWQRAVRGLSDDDFVYADPPYVGRHTDYFNQWSTEEAEKLASLMHSMNCGYALSMWLENKYRRNEHLDNLWQKNEWRTMSHFYHVGSTEDLRNQMQEALIIKHGYASTKEFDLEDSPAFATAERLAVNHLELFSAA